MRSVVKLQIVYEDPTLLPKGLNEIRKSLENSGCSMTVAPSWLVAACRNSLVKVAVVLPEGSLSFPPPRGSLVVLLEGEPEDLVRLSGLILSVGRSSGGGVLLSET